MDKAFTISPDDLARIKDFKIKVELMQTRAEKAAAEARLVAIEHQSYVQHVFLTYGLTMADRIDENTGAITRADEEGEEGADAPLDAAPEDAQE